MLFWHPSMSLLVIVPRLAARLYGSSQIALGSGGVMIFFFSSRRRHTRSTRDWSSECALPISVNVKAFPLKREFADINSLVPQSASSNYGQRGYSVGATDRYLFRSGGALTTLIQDTKFDRDRKSVV